MKSCGYIPGEQRHGVSRETYVQNIGDFLGPTSLAPQSGIPEIGTRCPLCVAPEASRGRIYTSIQNLRKILIFPLTKLGSSVILKMFFCLHPFKNHNFQLRHGITGASVCVYQ